MKPCVIIPCYNHVATVAAVARDAQALCPVIVVDDGSTLPLPALLGCTTIRLEFNRGGGRGARSLVGGNSTVA